MKPRKVLAILKDATDLTTLETAQRFAHRNDAKLDVVATFEPPNDLGVVSTLLGEESSKLIDELIAQRRTMLDTAVTSYNIETNVLIGKAFLEIIGYVIANGIDLVIKTAEPLVGVERFLFASTDQHLLRKCPCPVWLQTQEASPEPSRVLAAIDLDIWDADEPETLMSLNRRVVETARLIATDKTTDIVLMHAWDAVSEGMVFAFSDNHNGRLSAETYVNEVLDRRKTAMARFIAEMRNTPGPDLQPLLVRGSPEEAIHAQCNQNAPDVVVMGTVARTGLNGVFIGNTAENIINSLSCPVIAVKPDGFVSPVER